MQGDAAVMHEQVVSQLLSKVYDYVCVIDLKNKTIYVDFDELTERWDWTGEEHSYEEARLSLADNFIEPDDREIFKTNSEVDNIRAQLKDKDDYIFTCHFMMSNGEKHIKMFSYSYLDREEELVLTTLEDTTSLRFRDTLTGEYNRRGFIQAVQRILKDETYTEEFAVLYLNLRGFKAVNSIFGADRGDRVLRAIPKVIRESNLEPLAICRISADHFVCLVDADHINEDELKHLLHGTYKVNNQSLDIYAVCGIYLIDRNRMVNVSDMLDAAKMAQSHIEDEYVKPYAVFDEEIRKHYLERTEVSSAMTTALENGEFKIYYQPVYNAQTREIASAEALVRWQKANGEIVSPGVFVPVLEENGRISQMDLFVERAVLSFLEERYEKNEFIVPVSMNMSQMDFYDKNMMASVLLDISNTSLPLDYMRFEVTETAYASVAENNRNALMDMKKSGVKLYLDDFGSGYSSFSTVRDFEFNVLKIDMGFVRNIGASCRANSVIHSIISMAHAIGSKVVAEGVETEEQLTFLTECECDYIQGYYFSKPLPQDEFAELLNHVTWNAI